MSGESNGPTLLGPNGAALRPPKTDVHGRVLKHNAKIEEVYEIVAEETAKVHEFYLQQIPTYVARMIQDALMSYGLIKLNPAVEGQLVAVPEGGSEAVNLTPEAAAEGPSGLVSQVASRVVSKVVSEVVSRPTPSEPVP